MSSLLVNLALVQGWGWGSSLNPSSWSLSAEFAAYLLFPVLVPVVHCRAWSVWGVLTVAAALLVASVHLASPETMRYGPLDVPDNWSAAPLLRCLGGFLTGMAAYRLSRAPAAVVRLAFPGTAEVALACLVGAVLAGVPDLALYPFFPLLVATLAASRGAAARTLASRVPHYLGVLSFAIYLVHFPIIQIAIAGSAPSFKLIASLLSAVLVVAWTGHVLVERPGRWLGLLLAARIGTASRPVRERVNGPGSAQATLNNVAGLDHDRVLGFPLVENPTKKGTF